MDRPTTIIRTALRHSLFIGAHSNLPWFTTLQQRALVALEAIESGVDDHTCACEGTGRDNTVVAPCAWPREEGCET